MDSHQKTSGFTFNAQYTIKYTELTYNYHDKVKVWYMDLRVEAIRGPYNMSYNGFFTYLGHVM